MERARDREKQVRAFVIYRSHRLVIVFSVSFLQMFVFADSDVFNLFFRRPRGLSPNVSVSFPAVFVGYLLMFSCNYR